MELNDRAEVANYLENEAANLQDADFAEKLMGAADELRNGTGHVALPKVSYSVTQGPASVQFRAEPVWGWDSKFPEDHPSTLLADISSTFAEATSDSLVVLDNLAAVDMEHVDPDWRHALALSLERDLDQVTKLYRSAIALARTLTAEEDDDER